MARNEGQFSGSFNFTVSAGIYADTFTLVVSIVVYIVTTIYIQEEVVVVARKGHFRKHELGHRARCHVRKL